MHKTAWGVDGTSMKFVEDFVFKGKNVEYGVLCELTF